MIIKNLGKRWMILVKWTKIIVFAVFVFSFWTRWIIATTYLQLPRDSDVTAGRIYPYKYKSIVAYMTEKEYLMEKYLLFLEYFSIGLLLIIIVLFGSKTIDRMINKDH